MDDNDVTALAESVGNDLFGGETRPEVELGDSSPAIADPSPGLTPAEIRALPKAWKKDMEAHWTKLPKEVHDYVYEREADVTRGINQYAEGHKSWNNLLKPYQSLLQQHPNVNPLELMQGLMNSHLELLSADPGQKRALVSRMAKAYGLDLDTVPGDQPNPAQDALQRRLASLESRLESTHKQQQEEKLAASMKVVEEFASNPGNKYYKDVENDILRFLKTGAATDLASAYELAIYANPDVRAKVIAEQQSTARPPVNSGKKFPNLDGNDSALSKPKLGSIDDTINSVVSKHYSKH